MPTLSTASLPLRRRRPAKQPLPRPRWERRYAWAVAAVDLSAVLAVVAVGHVLGLGNYAPRFGGTISPGLGLIVALLTVPRCC